MAFDSGATNLVSEDTNEIWNIFVHEQDLSTIISGKCRCGWRASDLLQRNPSVRYGRWGGELRHLALPYGWSDEVTPSKMGYMFRPESNSYANVTMDQVNQDFVAIPVSYFGPMTMWTAAFNYNKGWHVDMHPCMVGDVNADGKADLVGFGLNGVYIGLSHGTP
jgi:hypothetical protein